MKTTKTYKQNFVGGRDLSNLANIEFTDFVGSFDYGMDNLKNNFVGQKTLHDYKNATGVKELHDYKNVEGLGEDLDNQLYTNADGSLTPAEVQEVWRNQDGLTPFQDWVKTDKAKQALAYQLQLKTHPEGKLSAKVIKKLYKESKSTLPMNEWVKTDAAKGAFAAYAHDNSGSKQNFGDWLQTDSAKQILSNATILTALAIGTKNGTIDTEGKTEQPKTPPASTSGQTTILGMNPITFGIVGVSVLVVGMFLVNKIK